MFKVSFKSGGYTKVDLDKQILPLGFIKMTDLIGKLVGTNLQRRDRQWLIVLVKGDEGEER